MKKAYKTTEYLTDRELVLKNGKPIHVKFLKQGVEASKFFVEDFDSDDLQPCFLKIEPQLFELLEREFPKLKWIGQSFEIIRLPKPMGGKPNPYKVAKLKVE